MLIFSPAFLTQQFEQIVGKLLFPGQLSKRSGRTSLSKHKSTKKEMKMCFFYLLLNVLIPLHTLCVCVCVWYEVRWISDLILFLTLFSISFFPVVLKIMLMISKICKYT